MTTPLPPLTEPDPIVEVRYDTRVVCPPELELPLPPRPDIPEDAIVETNETGGLYLAAELSWAGSVTRLFIDARDACRSEVEREAVQP